MTGEPTLEPLIRIAEGITAFSYFFAQLAAYCFFLYYLSEIQRRRRRYPAAWARQLFFPLVGGGLIGSIYAVVYSGTLLLGAPGHFQFVCLVDAIIRGVSILFFVVGGAVLSARVAMPFFELTRRWLQGGWRKHQLSWSSAFNLILMWGFSATACLISLFDVRPGHALEDPVLQQLQRHTGIMVFAVNTAIWEECMYRQFLFPFFAWTGSLVFKPQVAVGVVGGLVTALFALAHAGNMVPVCAKLFQMSLLSLGALVCQKKYGIEIAILFHAWFNVSMVWLS